MESFRKGLDKYIIKYRFSRKNSNYYYMGTEERLVFC